MKRLIGVVFILIGFCSAVYHYAEWRSGASAAEQLTATETKKYQEAAKAPPAAFSPKAETTTRPLPAPRANHESGTKVAHLIIPDIKQKYSVYWGADEQTLKKGVGMFVSDSTTAPDGNGHTVLSGHRDTVFVRLGELKQNDELLVEYEGSLYTYQITKTWITDADDRTVIVKKNEPTLTLTTCYPFNYIGPAPERYIIQASLRSVAETNR